VQWPRDGSRRLAEELKRAGWPINRKRVQRLMREENLLVQVRRYCRTTNSVHEYGRYPNLIKHLQIVRPNQVWCADLTYIRLSSQFIYLAVILDIFTRSIRGWELAGNVARGSGADQYVRTRQTNGKCLCRTIDEDAQRGRSLTQRVGGSG
jgi:transposase InsO family protein